MDALAGKAVVVTGAGRGIGAAIAGHAAELGAAVVVNDIDAEQAQATAQAIVAAGGAAVADGADIRSPTAAEAMIGRCVEAFGRIDGLVNNAGLFGIARLEDESAPRLEAMLAVNVVGTFNCAQAAIRRMYAQGSGAIVNVVSGAQCGIELMTAYGATKGAVASMTYAWALEAAGKGVRVNAVSPRAMTRMTEVVDDHRRAQGLPVRSGGPSPEANAPLVCYLLSDAAAATNGQIVRIDGPALSLMTHPAIAAPVLTSEAWDFEAIRSAFENELAELQSPLGVSRA